MDLSQMIQSFTDYLQSLDLDWGALLIGAAIMVGCTLLAALLGRFLFGKRSGLSTIVTSSLSLVFVYILTIVLYCIDTMFEPILTALPMLQLSDGALTFLNLETAHYTEISTELLHLVLLGFLANLFDRWIPKGEHVLSWLFFRIAAMVLSFAAYLALLWVGTQFLPEDIQTYAPIILLSILALMLLTGALKIPVGLLLTTVNPLIAALYTFFFANIIGKLLTRAVFTAGILTGLIYLFSKIGMGTILLGSAALIAYLPFIILLVILWYIVYRFL